TAMRIPAAAKCGTVFANWWRQKHPNTNGVRREKIYQGARHVVCALGRDPRARVHLPSGIVFTQRSSLELVRHLEQRRTAEIGGQPQRQAVRTSRAVRSRAHCGRRAAEQKPGGEGAVVGLVGVLVRYT